MKNLEEKRWAVGTLFLGVLLGVLGNLFANVLDRHYVRFGVSYDIGVSVLFFLLVWILEKKFTKLLGK